MKSAEPIYSTKQNLLPVGRSSLFIQPKLTINNPNDSYEHEADAMADRVMRMENPGIQLKPLPITSVQRKCAHCEEEEKKMQRKEMNGQETTADSGLENYVGNLNGGGQSLSKEVRNFYEPRFGYDFSNVKVHTDAVAVKSAQSINALAYTSGNNIVFNNGHYSPNTDSGKRLLGHELTHVVQQGKSTGALQKATPANGTKFIQRSCGTAGIAVAAGTHAGCNDTFDNIFIAGSIFKFNKDCDEFAPGQEAALVSFVKGLPATTTIEVHSYASIDGNANFNKDLGCARGIKAQTTITSPGGGGLAASRVVSVVNHGPVPGPAAQRRSVVLRTINTPGPPPPPPPALAVAFTPVQSSTSPAGMPNRIPPRVDTLVGVGILNFSIPMIPITLSIDGAGGGNGTATINGTPTVNLISTGTVNLRGVDQTDVGKAGKLKLVAKQGAATLATSNNFSVSAIGQNHSMVFDSLVTGAMRGMFVRHTWESDSGVVGDLDKTDIRERVEIDTQGGSLSSVTLITGAYDGEGTITFVDQHGVGVTKATGFITLKQTQMFKDNRTGAVDIPMKGSGYKIGHFILPKPGTGFLGLFQDFEMTTLKFGNSTTALGIRSNAGRGSETKVQNV